MAIMPTLLSYGKYVLILVILAFAIKVLMDHKKEVKEILAALKWFHKKYIKRD